MTFMNPTKDQIKMWRNNKIVLEQKLQNVLTIPVGQRDDEEVEFLTERIEHINDLLNPQRDEKNPAIN